MRASNKRGVSRISYSSMVKGTTNKAIAHNAGIKLKTKPMQFASTSKSKQQKSAIKRAVSRSFTPPKIKPKKRP